MTPELSIQALRELCEAYDRKRKSWPESEFEGWAVFRFICEEVKHQTLPEEAPENWAFEETPRPGGM